MPIMVLYVVGEHTVGSKWARVKISMLVPQVDSLSIPVSVMYC